MNNSNDKLVEVYSGTLWEAEFIKSLLKDISLNCMLMNETINDYAFDPIKAEGVKVLVFEKDILPARKIIEEFLKNRE